MKKTFNRCISIVLIVILALSLTSCSKSEENVLPFLEYGYEYPYDINLDGVICENENWSLIWNDEYKRISFLDKKTGVTWGQTPEERIEKQEAIGVSLIQVNSAITVNYQDPGSMAEFSLFSYYDAYENGKITVRRINDGIRVMYDFTEYEIVVPVDYTISKDCFNVKIVPYYIAQGKKCNISSVNVAPFVCGVENDAKDSWLFIPDGSGILVEPFTSDTLGAFGKSEVYGHDLSIQQYGYSNKTKQINMPVYGVKKGKNALLAIIDSAASAASINWELGSSTYGCSTVYSSFRLRGTKLISRPDNFISKINLSEINIYTEGVLKDEIVVKYYSLSGDKASITGMADQYREYLIGNGTLKKSKAEEKTAALKFIGGVVQPEFVLGVPSSKLFTLTDAESVSKITKELSEKIGNDISVDLVGFGESGVDIGKLAGGFKTAESLGGNKGMQSLSNTLKDMGIESYMDFDLISFNESGDGFSEDNAAIYEGGEVVTYTSFDPISHVSNDDKFYVLSRKSLFTAADTLVKKAEDMNLFGVSLGSVSNTIYSDYISQEYYACGKMEEDVNKIYDSVKKGGYNILSSSANIYAAGRSDAVIDAPLYSSDYNFKSYDVPFYQMVLKGYVPMSSVSINLCSDQEDALLRCVSSGITPSYTIIENYDNELITNPHSFIHSSVYSSNKENIIGDINEVSQYLESVKGAEIKDYSIIGEDIVKTEFSNGVWVVVNYSDAEVNSEYGKIPAKSFISGRDK